MKKFAFVYTEFQQNVLLAICTQKNIKIDIIFIRDNISNHQSLNIFTNKIIYFKDIPYSWKSIKSYINEYNNTILPETNPKHEYEVFTWSIDHPIVRLFVNKTKTIQINLFEEGAGSYIKQSYAKPMRKDYLLKNIISFILDLISFKYKSIKTKTITGWSLYEGCFPNFKIQSALIHQNNFIKTLIRQDQNSNNLSLYQDAIVFIQQAYIEMGILNENEYIKIHINAVLKIKENVSNSKLKIMWALHPRTNILNEKKRISSIESITGVELVLIKEKINIENIAFANLNRNISYYSLGSSSLYVILTFSSKIHKVYLIINENLIEKLFSQSQLNQLYSSFGIKLI